MLFCATPKLPEHPGFWCAVVRTWPGWYRFRLLGKTRIEPMQLFRYDDHRSRDGDPELVACWLHSEDVVYAMRKFGSATKVYCVACAQVQGLRVGRKHDPIDTRDGMACIECGLNARVRAGIGLLQALAPDAADVYITEQATPTYIWMQQHYPDIRGSEYQPDPVKREALAVQLANLGGHGTIDFEDVTRLSYASGSLDAVLSFDVLEHVPEYRAALREFARVLTPGGVLLATFPFTDQLCTIMRASVGADDVLTHLLEPEYHDDPISGGTLCFYHFGWDVLEETRLAGFASAQMVMVWAPHQGLLYGHWILAATR